MEAAENGMRWNGDFRTAPRNLTQCCRKTCPFDLQHGKITQLGLHPEAIHITVTFGHK